MHTKIILNDEMATLELAAKLAALNIKNTIIYLYGDLGTGKTSFVRFFLQTLGFRETIKSPTYALVESYQIDPYVIHHFDLYRLENPQELTWIGIPDYFAEEATIFIEWPEKGGHYLPKADISCFFNILADDKRELILKSSSERGSKLLKKLFELD